MSQLPELAVLYEQHAGRAYAFAYHLTGDRALAEDLLQDAFLRVAGRLRTVQPESFPAYLNRTIANLATSHWRRRQVERAHLARQLPGLGHADEAGSVDLRRTLNEELLRLPARQRVAVVARYYLDWPDEDIAEALSCRPVTVRSLISRGLARLRPAFAGHSEPAPPTPCRAPHE